MTSTTQYPKHECIIRGIVEPGDLQNLYKKLETRLDDLSENEPLSIVEHVYHRPPKAFSNDATHEVIVQKHTNVQADDLWGESNAADFEPTLRLVKYGKYDLAKDAASPIRHVEIANVTANIREFLPILGLQYKHSRGRVGRRFRTRNGIEVDVFRVRALDQAEMDLPSGDDAAFHVPANSKSVETSPWLVCVRSLLYADKDVLEQAAALREFANMMAPELKEVLQSQIEPPNRR